MLRSIKLMRTLNISSRRLRFSLNRLDNIVKSNIIDHPQVLSSGLNIYQSRNYVTRVVHNYQERAGDIESRLNEVDTKIRMVGRIWKNDIEKLLKCVSEKGSLTPTQALLLIRCCGDLLSGESLKTRKALCDTVWETIKAVGVSLDVSHYNALLLVLLENEIDFSPLDYLLDMKNVQIQPNRVTFQRLIDQYCNKGDIAGATKILEHMNEQQLPLNESIFSSLIKGHINSGDLENAVNMLNVMKEAGIEPSSITYNALLCCYAKIGDIEKIKSTLDELTKKDILISDKNLLDIIYTLAINNHSNHVDEVMKMLVKGSTYNRDAIHTINKLIDKKSLEVAYKILKSMKITARFSMEEKVNSGHFFIKKLVHNETRVSDVIKYCNLMKTDGLNDIVFEVALETAYLLKQHNIGLALLRGSKKASCEVREHYFYPILCGYGRANNIQDLLSTLKSMVSEFEIIPKVETIQDYVLPYMVGDSTKCMEMLTNSNVPFAAAANAMVTTLLYQNKLNQAAKFMTTTNLAFKVNLLKNGLINAFLSTKSVDSLVEIMHHQYVQNLKKKETKLDEEDMDQSPDTDFQNTFLIKLFKSLPKFNTTLTEELLSKLYEKGVPITKNAYNEIRDGLGDYSTPRISELLEKLSTEELELQMPEKENIWYNKGKYGFGIQKVQKLKDNIEAAIKAGESTTPFKFELLENYCRRGEETEAFKLVEELKAENVTFSSDCYTALLNLYVRSGKLDEAKDMYEQLKTQDPDYKLRKALILNNAILLVKNNNLEDAFKFLDQPAFDEDLERPILCERLLNTVFKNCENFEDIEKFFNKLLSKNYFKTVTTTMLSPLIKFYLDRDDIPKALEQFAWACNTHKVTPQKNVIMMKLIKNEDAKSLQHVTDLCTQVHGEINALFDLALAFLDCDRPNQAKRILETPGIRLRKGRVLAVAEKYASDGDTQKLEDLIKLLTGLFYHIEPLYMLLLNCYDQKGEWNNCLSLWTQMQEDNIQPSEQFLTRLENILVNNGQSVPFAKTNSNSKIHEEFQSYLDISNYDKAEEVLKKVPEDISDKLRAKLCKKYLLDDKVQEALVNLDYLLKKKSNAFSNDLVKTALNKLVEKKDFKNIEKLGAELSRSLKKNVDYAKYLNKIYVENEKWDEFLSKRDDMITYQNIDLNKDFHCPTVLNIIESDSLKKEAFKSFAFKAFEANIYGPLHILWIHYFIKDDPEAENIWNNYLKGTQTLYSINLIATCRDIEAWDKFSFIANKIKESSIKIDEKRKSYDFMLKVLINSSDDKKFERAHEILSIATEIMPLHRFNQELRKTIEIGIKNHDLSLDEFEQKEEKNIKENLVA